MKGETQYSNEHQYFFLVIYSWWPDIMGHTKGRFFCYGYTTRYCLSKLALLKHITREYNIDILKRSLLHNKCNPYWSFKTHYYCLPTFSHIMKYLLFCFKLFSLTKLNLMTIFCLHCIRTICMRIFKKRFPFPKYIFFIFYIDLYWSWKRLEITNFPQFT